MRARDRRITVRRRPRVALCRQGLNAGSHNDDADARAIASVSKPIASSSSARDDHVASLLVRNCVLAVQTVELNALRAAQLLEQHITILSENASSLRCPFWRRRFADILDPCLDTLSWALITRHKSLPLGDAVLSLARDRAVTSHHKNYNVESNEAASRGVDEVASLPTPELGTTGLDMRLDRNTTTTRCAGKLLGLSAEQRLAIVREDFEKRQYYVTGRLSKTIYADHCVFDGPDPDVPVQGLTKYVDAASGLFYRPLSRVDLIRIGLMPDGESVRARWRLEGALNLPWRPKIKPYVGQTTYTFDENGLVTSHVETWSVSALDAFASTLLPFLPFGAPPAPPASVLRAGTALVDKADGEDGVEYEVRQDWTAQELDGNDSLIPSLRDVSSRATRSLGG